MAANVATLPVAQGDAGAILESVIIKGDLSKLTPAERVDYYRRVCESIGVNPLTQPLAYIRLSGKEVLYAKRDCADQLRKLHGISIEIVRQEVKSGLATVEVKATDSSGRVDSDIGAVPVEGLKGEALANALLKAVTKAKRRVTLSLSGLGFLDETEVESVIATEQPPARPPVTVLPPTSEPPPFDPNADVEEQKPARGEFWSRPSYEIVPDGKPPRCDWAKWCRHMKKGASAAETEEEMAKLRRDNAEWLAMLGRVDEEAHQDLVAYLSDREAELSPFGLPPLDGDR